MRLHRSATATILAGAVLAACTRAEPVVVPTTTSPPPAAPGVTAVDGEPDAAPALQRFVDDLVAGQDMVSTCWTVAPTRARKMYADVPTLLSAATGDVETTPTTVVWTDGTSALTVPRDDITAGYACPYLTAEGDPNAMFTGIDGIYLAQRYLLRLAGRPVGDGDATDTTDPLACADSTSPHPLRDNPPDIGTIGLIDSGGASAIPAIGNNLRLTIPTEVDGFWRDIYAWVRIGPDGYCLEELG